MVLHKAIINNFRKDVENIKEEFGYPALEHAFVHLSVKLIFDLDDEETASYCSIGIFGHDKGIDAFFEQDDTLFIIQGKYARKQKKFKRNELTDLQSAISFLSNIPSGVKKPELLKLTQVSVLRKVNFFG